MSVVKDLVRFNVITSFLLCNQYSYFRNQLIETWQYTDESMLSMKKKDMIPITRLSQQQSAEEILKLNDAF